MSFDPTKGPALGVKGAWPIEELQLQQVRLLPSDNSAVESRKGVELKRTFFFKHAGHHYTRLPIIAANMFGVGTIPMTQVLQKHHMQVALEKHTDVDSIISFLKNPNNDELALIPSVGFKDEDKQRLRAIFEHAGSATPQTIMVDVPNGHMQKMLDTVKTYRDLYPNTVIMAGNVATGGMAAKIIEAGADVVKIGIGPGSACTTKLVAGVHRPQFAAVRECSQAAHEVDGYVIADGGVKTAGDVSIAYAAGADFVMIGGAFAAHDESGEPIYTDKDGRQWQEFMGSSSAAYMNRTMGEVAHYRAAEGELQWIPYKGSIEADGAILKEILGGVRSAFSYAGANSMEEFSMMARKAYLGHERGLNLVKAEMALASKGPNPHIVSGRDNPLTNKPPLPDLIQS